MEYENPSTFVGRIYKLQCEDGHYYIGSTKTELKNRLYAHKTSAIRFPDRKVYKYINDYGWDKTKIVCVEEINCKERCDMLEKENEYIRKNILDPLCLNQNDAMLKEGERKQKQKKYLIENKEKVDAYHAEYRLKNAEKRREYTRQYTAEHKEEVIAARKEFYEQNKEEILAAQKVYVKKNAARIREYKKKYVEEHKEELKEAQQKYAAENKEKISQRGKAYYEANKEVLKQKFKIYREANREKLNARQKELAAKRGKVPSEVHPCECGGHYIKRHEGRHKASKRHLKFLDSLEKAK